MDPRRIAAELRALADQLDPHPEAAAAGELALEDLITPGDLVQILPSADPTWGGMLMRVTKSRPHEVRGYLLPPHRGGCRAAWRRFQPHMVLRVGRQIYPQPIWGMHQWCATPHCDRGSRRDPPTP